MYIKSLTMDGFKSYATKTTITSLDRHFTAITGANGSGKSNIIDALLFVLDLAPSSRLRVSNLLELINSQCKHCQVILEFDNSDKSASPSGYEQFDKLVLSREMNPECKSRFKMNGHSISRTTLSHFCKLCGISSNFVIQQGEITKLLKIKSTDLELLIEEAAGTKHYNHEKEKAIQELERKENKLKEVKTYLKSVIGPIADKMEKERKASEKWEENKEIIEKNKKEIQILEKKLKSINKNKGINEIVKIKERWEIKRKELKEIEDKLNRIEREESREDIMEMIKEIEEMQAVIEECSTEKIKKEIKRINEKKKNKEKQEEIKKKEEILERELEDREMGNEGIEKIEELERIRREIIRNETEEKEVNRRVNEMMKQIREKIKRIKEMNGMVDELNMLAGKANEKDKCVINGVLTEIKNKVVVIVKNSNKIDDGKPGQTIKEREAQIVPVIGELYKFIDQNTEMIKNRINIVRSKLGYNIGEGIYGTVEENYSVVGNKYETALRVILGGRARLVICEDDKIAAGLIQQAERRISCIALNRVVARADVRKQTGASSGIDPLAVIRFDSKYTQLFNNLFNGFVIFESAEEARRACAAGHCTGVTLDGTVYDPRGTLTGGRVQPSSGTGSGGAELRILNMLYTLMTRISGGDSRACNFISECVEALKKQQLLADTNTSLRERASLLESLCGEDMDARAELERVRAELAQLASLSLGHTPGHERSIEELEAELREKEQLRSATEAALSERRTALSAAERRNGMRRASMHEAEGLELRRKELLQECASLLSRGGRLYNSFAEDEPAAPFSFDILDEQFCVDPDLIRDETVPAEESIEELKRHIDKLRVTVRQLPRPPMAGTGFELLSMHLEMVRDLESKIARLEEDRARITQSIEKLSELGEEAKKAAFMKVNDSVGRFFRYFVADSDVIIGDNYEVRVKIGRWVDSLSELSGGQRSLVALSLMFSLLACTPAPLYLFDEVDAALDLNYTQRIGEVIRKEFSNAQFIVVSLKSNMFDCANKIFRVGMRDGNTTLLQAGPNIQ